MTEQSPAGPSPRGLWINPAVGVAGDMLVAALLDLGADLDAVRAAVGSVGLPDWSLDATRTSRRGLTATAVTVAAPDHDHHRSWSTIDAVLERAELPATVGDGARDTFRRLAVAESSVHGIEIDRVHFHEVGAVDAIVDVVGTWAALHDLGCPTVTCAPIGLGVGTAAMAHGAVPVPAPATLELLRGIPTAGFDVPAETATPTGAALLVSMARGWGPMPAGTISGIGRGAGTWDPSSHPNVVTAVSYEPAADAQGAGQIPRPWSTVSAVIVETNVDDVTPEVLGHVLDRALELGADDAWILAATMKKNRPGHQVRVLCRPELVAAVRELLSRETGTLGLREVPVTKHELERSETEVDLDGHRIRIKVGPYGAKPEHDDVVAASRALDRPVRLVAAEALARFSRSAGA